MKNYLSFGGGVNSVAMYLHLIEQGVDFEAVFVDHGCDLPETYKYVEKFRKDYPVTVVKPQKPLYDYSFHKKMFPHRRIRWCTDRFKRTVFNRYAKSPCFVFIGYDYGERHRAKISSENGREFRWPLIEAEIDRQGCKDIIKRHGLPVPPKSGCYICPFQRIDQLKKLSKEHPELFCKLERLENRNNDERQRRGLEPYYSWKVPVRVVAERDVKQSKLWAEDEYPPCECWL